MFNTRYFYQTENSEDVKSVVFNDIFEEKNQKHREALASKISNILIEENPKLAIDPMELTILFKNSGGGYNYYYFEITIDMMPVIDVREVKL